MGTTTLTVDEKEANQQGLLAWVESINERLGEDPRSLPGPVLVIHPESMDTPKISTGVPQLDYIAGGGLPAGRIIEIIGRPNTGKSSIATSIAAAIQEEGKNVLWVDAENGFNPDYARKNALDIDSQFSLLKPCFYEDTLKVIELAARSQRFGLIVFDSLVMMLPSKDWDNKTYGEDGVVGIAPDLLQGFCTQVIPLLFHSQTTLLLINQPRRSITPYGTYDHSWHNHPVSICLETTQIQEEADDPYSAIQVQVEVIKNKFAAPYQRTKLHITSNGIQERQLLAA